jgi:hypothetical protein
MILAFPDNPPLVGPYRLPLMLIEISIVLVAIDIAVIYIKKYKTLKNSLKSTRIHAAWVCLFLGYAEMEFWYWLADFYTTSTEKGIMLYSLDIFARQPGHFFLFITLNKSHSCQDTGSSPKCIEYYTSSSSS